MPFLDTSGIMPVAHGLGYPEGPVWCGDGSVLVVEIHGQRLTRCREGNQKDTVASMPGGPNGAAVGPAIDGKPQVWVCNDGGFVWAQIPPEGSDPWLLITTVQPPGYQGGKLQRVELESGKVHDEFTASTASGKTQSVPLKGPDDLVFDAHGGLWLTDFGKQRVADKDITGVFYVAPGGGTMEFAIPGLNSPNGIGLSPDGSWLYVACSYERRVLKYRLGDDGRIVPNKKTLDGSYLHTGDFVGCSVLDSMAVDAEGNLYVATMVPQGADPMVNGGITVVAPDGKTTFIELDLAGLPDAPPACPLPSNICFGGQDLKTAYITCGGTGHLVAVPSEIPGLKLAYNI